MLTTRKQSFIDHYIITKNATKAAQAAGYSLKTAYSQGSRLLNNAEVRSLIDKRLDEQAITREAIIQNLWVEAKNANRSSDRIAANVALAKIRGDIKDNTTTQVSVFTGDMVKDLPPIDIKQEELPDKPCG